MSDHFSLPLIDPSCEMTAVAPRTRLETTIGGCDRLILHVRKEARRLQRADERLFGRLCRGTRGFGGGALDSRQLARDLRRILTLHHRAHAGGSR
jgi:hypothetical protein